MGVVWVNDDDNFVDPRDILKKVVAMKGDWFAVEG